MGQLKQTFINLGSKVRFWFYEQLNEKQREKISSLCDKFAIGALFPVALRMMSDGKSGDGWAIFFWLLCAIIFSCLSVAAMAAKEQKGDDS